MTSRTTPRRSTDLRTAPVAIVAALVCAVLLLAPGQANAQGFGSQGQIAISADNLFGVAGGEKETERPGPDIEDDFTVFGLGWVIPDSLLWWPRIAVDGFVIDGLSVGGSLGFFFFDDDDDRDDDDGTGFIIAPRVGYAYMFADWVGIWGRGGFTFYTLSEEPFFDQNQFALDLEAIFLFALTDGFGIGVGPAAHIGLAGERDFDPDDNLDGFDYREWGIGITVNLTGWLDT